MARERRRRAADPRNRVEPPTPRSRPAPPRHPAVGTDGLGRETPPPGLPQLSPGPFIGMAGLACDFFLAGASALLAPWWAVLLLAVAWVACAVACVRWWTPHPDRLVPVVIGYAVGWFAVLVAGGLALGWRIR